MTFLVFYFDTPIYDHDTYPRDNTSKKVSCPPCLLLLALYTNLRRARICWPALRHALFLLFVTDLAVDRQLHSVIPGDMQLSYMHHNESSQASQASSGLLNFIDKRLWVRFAPQKVLTETRDDQCTARAQVDGHCITP